MPDQVPDDVKRDRIERLVEVVQRVAAHRNADRVGRVEQVLVEGASRTDDSLLRGRTRRNTTVNFTGAARWTPEASTVSRPGDGGFADIASSPQPGDLVDVAIERATSTTLAGAAVPALQAVSAARS